MKTSPTYRPAAPQDLVEIAALLNNGEAVHRHLDWRAPMEWLEFEPFWVMQQDQRLCALLAAPADPPHVAWLRLFAAARLQHLPGAWNGLLERCLGQLLARKPITIAALGLSDWFSALLFSAGFTLHQKVITLAWNGTLPAYYAALPGLRFRRMAAADLPRVQHIDALAFEPIWQNSLAEIERAFLQSGYATVAELDGEVVGFQISTLSAYHLHLARLAVQPDHQRLSIGLGLVYHLAQYCQQQLCQVTVNTQDTNLASQGLYKKLGFIPTGDDFSVFIYP